MLTNFSDFNQLNEGLSSVLYHFTHLSNLKNILHENNFQASINIGSDADKKINKNKYYFFSTQRTKGTEGYGKNHGSVCIVLDGTLLGQRYKGLPIDYWQHSKNPKDYERDSDYKYALTSSEREDRIILDSPTIDGAKKYIKEVHIKIMSEYTSPDDIKEIQEDLGDIPLYLYSDDKSFRLLNKKNAKSLKEFNLPDKVDRYVSDSDDFIYTVKQVAPYYIYNDVENEEKIFKLVEKYIETVNRELKVVDVMNSIMHNKNQLGTYGTDIEYLKSYFHNERGNPNLFIRELFKLFVLDMKKLKVSDVKEYVQLKVKGSNTIDKAIEIIWDNKNSDIISVDSGVWGYIQSDKFLEEVPKEYHDTRITRLIEDKDLTFKKFLKNAMGAIGKYTTIDILKKFGIYIQKRYPKDSDYKEIKNHNDYI